MNDRLINYNVKLNQTFSHNLYLKFYFIALNNEKIYHRNAKNPPRVQNNIELSKWFCEQHNHVNVRLGKEEFDCDRVMERWRMGKSKNPKCL